MSQSSSKGNRSAVIELDARDAARLRSVAPAMALDDIAKTPVDLLYKAADALGTGIRVVENGEFAHIPAVAPLENAVRPKHASSTKHVERSQR